MIFKTIVDRILEKDYKETISQIILTGSYASELLGKTVYQQNGIRDYNFYVYVDGGDIDVFNTNLIIHQAIFEVMKEEDVPFIFDIHPFAFSIPVDDAKIQFTTRAISTRDKNQYANYCWNGWKENAFTLYKNKIKEDVFQDIPVLEKNEVWVKAISQAMSNYKNKILNLPLFSFNEKVCEMELIRYCKEIIKDGVQILVSKEEYKDKLHFHYLHQGKRGIMEFYKERNILTEFHSKIEYILGANDKVTCQGGEMNNSEIAELFFSIYEYMLEKMREISPEIVKEQMQWF